MLEVTDNAARARQVEESSRLSAALEGMGITAGLPCRVVEDMLPRLHNMSPMERFLLERECGFKMAKDITKDSDGKVDTGVSEGSGVKATLKVEKHLCS